MRTVEQVTCKECGKFLVNLDQYSSCPDGHGKLHGRLSHDEIKMQGRAEFIRKNKVVMVQTEKGKPWLVQASGSGKANPDLYRVRYRCKTPRGLKDRKAEGRQSLGPATLWGYQTDNDKPFVEMQPRDSDETH